MRGNIIMKGGQEDVRYNKSLDRISNRACEIGNCNTRAKNCQGNEEEAITLQRGLVPPPFKGGISIITPNIFDNNVDTID